MLALAAATALGLTAVALWRQRPAQAGVLCTGLLAGAVFFLLMAEPAWTALRLPAWLGPLAVNRAVRAGFDATQRPTWQDLLLAALSLGLGAAWPLGFDVLALLLFAEAPARVALQARDDLVARRRLARAWFLGGGSALALGVTLAAVLGGGAVRNQVAAAGTLLLCFTLAGRTWPSTAASPSPVPNSPAPAPLDAQEQQQLARLRQLMQAEAAFRDPQLTLSRLAQRLALPEHRVRRLIHLGEGHGHFSSYLNGLRIEAVKQALADPAQADTPVLQLATDAGYNALSVFNRAFKAREGCTPSAFRAARQAAMKAHNPNAPDTLKDT
jgi:AraC-like DNA-binding protein